MDANTLLSLLFSAGVVHPWGHISSPSNLDADLPGKPVIGDIRPYADRGTVDYKNFIETFPEPEDPRMAGVIHGGGFEAQDKTKAGMTGKQRDDMALANALYKAFYLSGGPKMMGSNTRYAGGDIEAMKDRTGNKYVGQILGASAVADLLDAFNVTPENHNLGFHVTAGAPGLMYTYRW